MRLDDGEGFGLRPEVTAEKCDQGGPTGLMTGANSCAIVTMAVLIEQHQVAPVRIPLLFFAAVVLAVSYVVARLVADLATAFLVAIGLDALPARRGLSWVVRMRSRVRPWRS